MKAEVIREEIGVEAAKAAILQQLSWLETSARCRALKLRMGKCVTYDQLERLSFRGLRATDKEEEILWNVLDAGYAEIERSSLHVRDTTRRWVFFGDDDNVEVIADINPKDLFNAAGRPNAQARKLLEQIRDHPHVRIDCL